MIPKLAPIFLFIGRPKIIWLNEILFTVWFSESDWMSVISLLIPVENKKELASNADYEAGLYGLIILPLLIAYPPPPKELNTGENCDFKSPNPNLE